MLGTSTVAFLPLCSILRESSACVPFEGFDDGIIKETEMRRVRRREAFEEVFSPSIRCLDPLPPSLLLPALSVRVDFFHEQIRIPFPAASQSVSVALS